MQSEPRYPRVRLRAWCAGLGVLVLAALTTECGSDPERKQRRNDDAGAGGSASGSAGCGPSCAGKGGVAGLGGDAGTTAGAGTGGSGTGGSAVTAGTNGADGGTSASGKGGSSPSGGSSTGDGGEHDNAGSGGTVSDGTLTIAKVALYQATEVTLSDAPANAESRTPIVADRAAEVRVFLQPEPGFVARDVTLSFTWLGKRGETRGSAQQRVSAASFPARLDSTLNFTISALDLGESNTLRIELADAADPEIRFDSWPASGAAEVRGSPAGGPFRLTLVPLVTRGFTPDLSPAVVDRFRSHLEALYPITSAEITLHEPVTLMTDVLGDDYGTGWGEALDDLYALRAEEDPQTNEFYYGVLTPGTSMDDYCPVSCVVGLSSLTVPSEEEYRGAIGTGFFDFPEETYSQETLEHELGHALGREHAPCDTDDAEPTFPYADGHIGVWGWDGTRLRDPNEDADVMSYCVPVWVSDHTFSGLFRRISALNALAGQALMERLPAPKRARTLILKADGDVSWGFARASRRSFDDANEQLELLDAKGRVLAVAPAHLTPFDHLPGGFLSVSADALELPGVVAVRTKNVTVAVP